ncbi:alpha/beta fold hydrolase [Phyllobacterium endophyticum]|uniref:alpha/beta fold hydrolase n=1 Tax=Phyllobacterium endophyticum TaxID=1149773 RepID=UPI0011CC8604|nr:alpha/beta hydrolase [Phyllobacterium endophyticum]TXR46503.1 alpha/beta hydrolase [Phyllobacterium endophyticum]
MANYVLVHGAWHTGAELQVVASLIRAMGHDVYTPTIKGNRPGDAKTVGLSEAIESIVEYLEETGIEDAILVGHSSGGMVITGVADRVRHRIRRLVYWNAYVPNDGESIQDMTAPHQVALFEAIAAERNDGTVVLPFPVWREAFINDADLETAQKAYDTLNPQPMQSFRDKISLSTNPAAMEIGKSYINCTDDTVSPHSHPWHPRLSEKLGLFRLIQIPGSHEISFTHPDRIARAIVEAGRD